MDKRVMFHLGFYQRKLTWQKFIILPSIALLMGCQPDNDTVQSQSQNTNVTNAKTTVKNPPAILLTTDNPPTQATKIYPKTADLAGQEIAERLEVSYARASAYTSKECPKLVEFQFSNQSITRQNEQFPKQNCDYIIYLRKGELLKVDVSNEVKAELVSPVNFDFANGSYTAPKYDKYTVRLSYDGTRFNPENFKYDVILTKAKSDATF